MADDREPQDWFGSSTPVQGEEQARPNLQPRARSGSSRRRWTGVGLVAAGLVAGGVLAGTLGASAATGSSTPTAGYSTGSSYGTPGADTDPAGEHGGGHGLDLSGTVTAVGSTSVTIKTTSGTVTYAVSGTSDIDKNGEAQLSSLAVGDAVTFSTTTSGSTVSIDKLHAGNETLDRPQGSATSG